MENQGLKSPPQHRWLQKLCGPGDYGLVEILNLAHTICNQHNAIWQLPWDTGAHAISSLLTEVILRGVRAGSLSLCPQKPRPTHSRAGEKLHLSPGIKPGCQSPGPKSFKHKCWQREHTSYGSSFSSTVTPTWKAQESQQDLNGTFCRAQSQGCSWRTGIWLFAQRLNAVFSSSAKKATHRHSST